LKRINSVEALIAKKISFLLGNKLNLLANVTERGLPPNLGLEVRVYSNFFRLLLLAKAEIIRFGTIISFSIKDSNLSKTFFLYILSGVLASLGNL
jgi:hypothetical protein